jgi:methylated-DNA-[protein]-cysteine S-methyltransferase
MQNKSDFNQLVYSKLKLVPRGKITTYAILAKSIGKPKACRAVGSSLAKNKHLITTPCHRVVRSDGKLGNYQKGHKAKKSILEKEGIKIDKMGKVVDFNKHLFYFNKR